MKLSTKLLLAVLIGAVFALVGTNLVLKAEYERIDFTNPFWKYERVPLTNQRPEHVVLSGYRFDPVEIRFGTAPALYVVKSIRDSLRVRTQGDSLFVQASPAGHLFEDQQPVRAYPDRQEQPSLILVLPRVASVRIDGQTWLRLRGSTPDSLRLTQRGYSVATFHECQIGTLRLILQDSSFAELAAPRQVQTLNLEASGKSGLRLKAEAVGRFRPIVRDERVELQLSGTGLTNAVSSLPR